MRSRVLVVLALLAVLCPDAEARRRNRRRGRPSPPVAPLTKDGWPNVMAASAVVADLATGEEIYAKNPDDVRRIASVGKLFVALTVRDRHLDLDGTTAITEGDRQYARGGSRSRLHEGKTFRNLDLLRAMLVASDNRAVTAVGRAAGLTPDALVTAMNGVAQKLGLKRTLFEDPTGLNGNVSTAREVLVALRANLEDPLLAEIGATPELEVRSTSHPYVVHYNSTNVALRARRYRILGGKTGYTDEARYCLAIAVEIEGRRLGMVFLGAEGELTRFADFNRVVDWYLGPRKTQGPKSAHAGGAGRAAEPPPTVVPRLAP